MDFDEKELWYKKEWIDEYPYITSYNVKITHRGLGRSVLMKDFNSDHLQSRILKQQATWNMLWKLEQYKSDSEPQAVYSHDLADQMTALAKSNLRMMKDLLQESLNTSIQLNWDLFKDHSQFPKVNPESALLTEIDLLPVPTEPLFKELPKEVNEENFTPKISFFDKLFGRSRRKMEDAQAEFQKAVKLWEEELTRIETENRDLRNEYLVKLTGAKRLKETLSEQCEREVNKWHQEFQMFTGKKNRHNQAIDQWKADFLEGKEEGVTAYFDYILHYSAYPDLISKTFDLSFITDDKSLVIDYQVPSPQQFPQIAEVRYIPLKGLLKEYSLSERQFSRAYNDAIYKMVLRTVYEVFKTDTSGHIEDIVYNGWVSHDENGRQSPICLVSLKVAKEDFLGINLLYSDSKTCFEELNGRSTEDLIKLEAVDPFVNTGFSSLVID